MKKLLLPLLAAAAIAVPASAQKVNVYASYGGYTQMDCCDNHDDWDHVNTAWGALNVGVDFQIGSRFRLGPSLHVLIDIDQGRQPCVAHRISRYPAQRQV